MVLLEIRDISMAFDGFRALDRVSFNVESGAIHALIGPNGAGKTTLLDVISGVYKLLGGDITYKGVSLKVMKPYERTALGIGRTFQSVRVFKSMTVLENVMIGRHCKTRSSILSNFLRVPFKQLTEERDTRSRALDLLETVGLWHKRDRLAGSLTLGEQRRLELARAMAVEPDLLLLDEPAAGLNPKEILELNDLIRAINSRGKTILLIEHNMRLVMSISDKVTVLSFGRTIANGTPIDVQTDSNVVQAYLGRGIEGKKRG